MRKRKDRGFLILIVAYSLIFACKPVNHEKPNHQAAVDSILDYTNSLLNAGNVQQSARYLDSAYQQLPSPGIIDLWRKYDHKSSFYLNYDFNLDKAKLYTDSMTFLLKGKTQQYKTEYANTIFAIGHVLLAEKRYSEAFKQFYDGRTFARQYLDSCSYYIFSNKLGLVRYNQGQYLKATSYLKQAFTEHLGCKTNTSFDKVIIFPQSCLNTIALCFEKSNMPDSAIFYYKKALVILDQNLYKYPKRKKFITIARGVICGNLGGAYAKNHQDKEAEIYLKESIMINSHPGYDFQDAQTAKLKLTDLYIAATRFNEAKTLLDELETYLGKKGNNPTTESLRLRWYQQKWSYFDKTGQHAEAYPYLQKYHTIQDSTRQVSAGLKEIDMDEIFRDTEQQYRLALLNKDNELKTGYLVAFIIVSALSIGILTGVWYSLKRSRRLNRQMTEQNLQLQNALNALEQSQQENTNLLKVVAHDLRNPIGGMTTLAGMMLEDSQRPEEDKNMLQLIQTSGQHSLELVNDLLMVNTMIKEPEKEFVDLNQMLHYCVNLLLFKAERKKQQLHLDARQVMASVNREKIWRVISNLIANAIKFSPEESVISVYMEQQEENSVLITVQDHGIGIPQRMREKIFDMFTEAQREGTGGEKPFGLGLAISKQIVEAHGGKIWFDTIVNEGTTFYVKLPLA